ncbi:MAG: M20/M25/M40 family metallo-hydrolase [Clostridia bacterium]|nr:M20/M25/M40 family metallo-hydrolase [Clostridia bacterium]MBR2221044.1 M20/M25/M40 family metallo-hydrolase [Clostridia bacterium]MBR2433516.1 M20/M25/M40 family metallo-hydrolase [Clostridia bacterium]
MKTKIFAALACALAIPAAAFAALPTNVVFAAEATPQRVEMLIDEYYLSDLEAVKNRTAGSTGELAMAQKLSGFMGAMNFDYFAAQTSYLQSLDISKTHTSQNVVGVLDNGAENYVILGAHYDCIYKDASFGYSDNLSGIVGLMATAEILQDYGAHNLIFAFWGAEEVGCLGSEYFVKNLPDEIKEKTLLYINFDSIGAGDYRYYYTNDFQTTYGAKVDKIFLSQDVKKYHNRLYSNATTNGVNYTTLGMQSDNASFLKAGINSLNFFAGNLSTNSGLGFFETANHPRIMHNTDTKTTIDEVFGQAHFAQNIAAFSNLAALILSDAQFTAETFAPGQINPSLYSDVTLKIAGVIFVVLGFGAYMLVYFLKYKKSK